MLLPLVMQDVLPESLRSLSFLATPAEANSGNKSLAQLTLQLVVDSSGVVNPEC